ncbi:MAG TPA: hypothetical protein VIX90_06325 [Edaphobacter sp.]
MTIACADARKSTVDCASLARFASKSATLRGWLIATALLVSHFGFAPASIAQNITTTAGATGPQGTIPADPLSIPPRAWVVDVITNELAALHHKNSYIRYHMHIVDSKGDQMRDIIESRDGTVARLIMRNGKPLTDEQDKAERQRLNDMLQSPDAYIKHVKNDTSEKKVAESLMRQMPDAMIHTYAPGQPQTGKNRDSLEIVIDYKPNPQYRPPTTFAEALAGLEGRAWIDAKSRQLVRMEGTVFRPVNFGWGMLAHIYPGGKLTFEQTDAGGGRQIFTHFTEHLTVRALMLKTINVNADVEASNFQIINPMNYQDAIHVLLDTPLPGR